MGGAFSGGRAICGGGAISGGGAIRRGGAINGGGVIIWGGAVSGGGPVATGVPCCGNRTGGVVGESGKKIGGGWPQPTLWG